METQNYELGVYEGTVIKVDDGMVNMTNMWKACGEDVTQKPSAWMRSVDARKVLIALEEKESKGANFAPLTEVKKGRYGGTFAHPVIGLAYAKYLSPDFHIWCNEWLLKSGLIETSDGELLVKLGEDGLPVEQTNLPAETKEYIKALESAIAKKDEQISMVMGVADAFMKRTEDIVEVKEYAASSFKKLKQLGDDVNTLFDSCGGIIQKGIDHNNAVVAKVKSRTKREQINKMVQSAATHEGTSIPTMWNNYIYPYLLNNYGFDVKKSRLHGENKLDAIERCNHLNDVCMYLINRYFYHQAMDYITLPFGADLSVA